MTRKNPLAKWTLPLDVYPATHTDWCVPVPDDPFYRAAFLGALWHLAEAYKWADDSDHTAKDVARVWRDIIDSLEKCQTPGVQLPVGNEDDEMSIFRVDCDCRVFVLCCDGTEKELLTKDAIIALLTQQPGAGSPQPGVNGGQACYQAQLNSNGQWLVPTTVNAGDQLVFSAVQGAAWDGATLGVWYCPNGQTFFAGQCIGPGGTSGTDIAPSIDHMRLIVNIGGVWYDAYNTTITVPGGVVASPVVVQVNDSSLSDNAGNLNFQVCVTNNQSGGWTHIFDFTSGPGPFSPVLNLGVPCATYVPGIGWESVVDHGFDVCRINAVGLPSANYSQVILDWTDTVEAISQILAGDATLAQFTAIMPLGPGSHVISSQIVAPYSATVFRIDANDTAHAVAGSIVFNKLTISGTGIDPF
jgi:hypothetical protein